MKLSKFIRWKLIIVFLSLPLILMAVQLGSTETFTSNINPWVGNPTNGIRQYASGSTKRMEIDSQATASRTYTFSGYANQSFRMTLTTTEIGTWENSSDTTIIKFNGVVVYNSDASGNLVLQGGFDSSGTVSVTITANTNDIAEKLHVDDIKIYSDPDYAINNLRPFSQAFISNEKGNIKIIGNSVLTTATGCTTLPNNSINAVNADQDSDGTTFNSTSADLTFPAGITGSHIKYAALYWQGRLAVNSLSTSIAAAKTVKLKLPGGNYQTLTSTNSKFNWRKSGSGNGDDYQGTVDITTLLQANVNTYATAAGYAQSIWIADVLTNTGTTNLYGAWSIVIVYHDDTTTLKSLTVYDGYLGINTSTSVADKTVPLSGFITPSTYPVNASFLIFGGEGDINYGDSVSLSDSIGTNILLNSGGEVFKSTITDENGNNVASRNPACSNTIGVDIHSYNIGKSSSGDTVGIIGINQTSTTVKLDSFTGSYTDYDTYFPGVFAFATDLYQPNMCYMEKIFNSNGVDISGVGVQVNKGDILKVQVTVKNDGREVAKGVQIQNQFDNAKFPYEVQTTKYENFNASFVHSAINATDVADSDNFEYNGASYLAKVNLGNGATSASGGDFVPITMNANAYAVYEYNGTVEVVDQNFSNEYYAAYKSDFGLDYSSNPTKMEPCSSEGNSFWAYYAPPISGKVDIVDPQNVATYTTAPVIKTKIANQPLISLSVINLDPNTLQPQNFTQSLGEFPLEVFLYRSSDALCTDELPLAEPIAGSPAGQPVIANIPVGSSWANTNSFTIRSVASATTYIKAKFADWSILLGGLTNSSSCFSNSNTSANLNGLPQCLNNLGANSGISQDLMTTYPNIVATCINQSGGTYSPCDSNAYNNTGSKGGIYPTKYNHAYGCLACILDSIPEVSSCSSDNFAIRPDTYTTTLTGSSPLVAGEDFNLTTVAKGLNNTSLTGYNGVAAIAPQTQIDLCAAPDGNLTNSSDGSFNSIIFNGVDTNVSNNIKFGDIGVFDVNITDSTWTVIDSTKSPMECIDGNNTNIADITGKIGCLIKTVISPTVIPHHFDVNGTLTNGSNGFTYLNNFDTNASLDQNISALLNAVVTAKAFDTNATTLNYSSECYAKDGNSSISFTLTPIAPSGSLTQHLWYDDINSSIIGSTTIGNSITPSHPSARFTNGVGTLNYRLNFNRSIMVPVNPLQMSIPQMVVSDVDNVTGTNSIDSNATYLFGRTHAARQRYEGNSGTANIYFESYCFGVGCDKTLLPNGPDSARIDDVRWYRNQNHIMPIDGTVGTVTQKGGVGTVSASTPTVANPAQTTLIYNGNKGYPYKTTMENNASNWLIQNEFNPNATINEFQVEFVGQTDWSGAHDTNTTSKAKATPWTNKRLDW